MANQIVLIDTSLLIDYFRKTDKANSVLVALFSQGYDFCISAITHYEIYSGATPVQLPFWKQVLDRVKVLSLDEAVSQTAVEINSSLKRKRKQISMADLFIAATALANNMSLATLNKKHFDRIEGLTILE